MAQRWLMVGLLAPLLGNGCSIDDRVVSTEPPLDVVSDPDGAGSGPSTPSPPGEGPGAAGGANRSGSVLAPTLATGGQPGAIPPSETPPVGSPADPLLSLTLGGDGFGQITLSAPGRVAQACDRGCQLAVPAGTIVTVQAAPRTYSVFRGWSEPTCGATTQTCSVRVDGATTLRVDLELGYNVAFVSSRFYGVAELPRPGEAANQECARLATEAGVHGTRWVAWLAAEGPTLSVADDISPNQFLQNPGGWVRRDGVPVAVTRSALFRGETLHAISLTEQGDAAALSSWSAAWRDGSLRRLADRAEDCANWTSLDPSLYAAVSESRGVGIDWIGLSAYSCLGDNTIQCFGDDPAPEVPIFPASGRLAFLSADYFFPGGGISAADELCQREACDAGLTGGTDCASNPGTQRTFRSYLHAPAQPAWERFDLSGPNWVRRDGVEWLSSASDLAEDGVGRLTGLNVRADGTYLVNENATWLGSPNDGEGSCESWTSSTGLGRLTSHSDAQSSVSLSAALGVDSDCGSSFAFLICLEE